MSAGQAGDGEDKDWRLTAELEVPDSGSALRSLLTRLRGPDIVEQIEPALPHDVVLTHDGKLLFAYALDQPTLAGARGAIEAVLREDGITARVRIGHWDEELDEWRQIDPPLSGERALREQAAERDEKAIETRTLVVSSGRVVRGEFEQTMQRWADELGLECTIVEHPHLLKTQVAFNVTGAKRKLDEFAEGLNAEEWATIRTESAVMMSPL
jgi:hypothetical protein